MHAKNLAFLYTDGGLRLTPHYDLVSTEVYDELVGLPWQHVRPMLLDLAAQVAGLASAVAQRCSDTYGPADMYVRIAGVATEHARRMVEN